MRTISYRLEDLKKVTIHIGYVGENEHTRVNIDAGEVFADNPDAVVTMKMQPPRGTAYPVTVSRDGDIVSWDVKNSDLVSKGAGEIQLTFTENTEVIKSCIARINIDRSIVGSGTVPDPVQDWIDEANKALEEIQTAEVNQPTIGEDGYWYTWNQETGEYEKTETKAQGADGAPGQDGSPGQDGQDATPDLITKDYDDLTFPVNAGTQCYHDGLLYYAKQDIQTAEAWTAAHWQNTTVEEQVTELKTAIDGMPETKFDSEENVDLDITDESGNVLVRLQNGEIKTKNFDSTTSGKALSTTEENVDLDVVDENGNSILRLKDGFIYTKNFDGKGIGTRAKVRTRMEFGAHNGARYYAPECSIPAYRIAGQQGWEWAWIAGIWFSADGTMYVMHDNTVDRTTDGTGTIAELTDTYINSLHIDLTGTGYNLSDFSQADLIVPTFEQILKICVRYNMKMVIRMNDFPYDYSTAEQKAKWDGLMDLLKAYNVPSDSVCFYIDTTFKGTQCRTMYGDDVCLAYFGGASTTAQDAVDWFEEKSLTGNLAHIINVANADLTAIKLLHTNGIKAFVYDISTNAQVSALADYGADICQNGRIYRLSE